MIWSLALLVFACSSRPPLPPKAVELNDRGVEALAAGDLETASARFTLALEYNPRFVEALSNLGLVELERGNFDLAAQLLGRARCINEQIAQPHHGLGVLAERRGQRDEAREHYRASLAIDPGFLPSRLNLARLLFDDGLLHEAKVEFEKSTQIDPDAADAYAGLAETLIRLSRRDEAERVVVEALRRFPSSASIQILTARSELRHGLTARAIARLQPLAGRGDETAATALSWLAVAELARHRPRAAIGAAKRALLLDQRALVARRALAQGLSELGDPRAREWKAR